MNDNSEALAKLLTLEQVRLESESELNLKKNVSLIRQSLVRAIDIIATLLFVQGKPLAESRGELAYSNSFIEWFAEEG